MNSQTGFLVSYLKYGDNDAVLHCFTREKGYQSFFARGIYSSKSKQKAYLLPLNELTFSFLKTRNSGNIQNVSKIDLVENPEFFNDIKANSIVFFIADFLNQMLRNEESSPKIYDEILFFLNELERKNYTSHFIFLIKFLKIQGLLPLYSENIYLNPESGNFTIHQYHNLFNSEISGIWKEVIAKENPYQIKIDSKIRKNFLESILMYYRHHFPDFRVPTSLEIVQQIFE